MMSIKRKKKEKNDDAKAAVTLRQQIKEIIDDIIDGSKRIEDESYIDKYLDDICQVLENYLDIQINNWTQSFEHHQAKENDWLQQKNFEFYDLHHSMKVYSNGAAHSLQFFKNELR